MGLEPFFTTVWANDNCEKTAAIYTANASTQIRIGSITDVTGGSLPSADLSWASFPCQDLSLAGNLTGIREGTRSGLFWEWVRVLDELDAAGKRVPVLAAENVVGFVVAHGGQDFRRAYQALRERRYKVGALVIDARHFVPQSRPRAFLVAVDEAIDISGLTQPAPSAPFHSDGLIHAAVALGDSNWIWWSLPLPTAARPQLVDIIERDAPCDSAGKTNELRKMLSTVNRRKLKAALDSGMFLGGTGYRRTRPDEDGASIQRLELRFDGIAGCLRTPGGGSSRQVVMIVENGTVRTRLLTVRECARLMGAPDSFVIPGSYNDGYRAMGDAVAVPVTNWLTRHLLAPLVAAPKIARDKSESAA